MHEATRRRDAILLSELREDVAFTQTNANKNDSGTQQQQQQQINPTTTAYMSCNKSIAYRLDCSIYELCWLFCCNVLE